jgi:hypothetical protein
MSRKRMKKGNTSEFTEQIQEDENVELSAVSKNL